MFWQKKKFKIEWPLLFFGFISVGIIVSVAILIVLISSRAKEHAGRFNFGSLRPPMIEVEKTPVEILNNYASAVEQFVNFTSSTELSSTAIIQKTEDWFLDVRVPAEKKDIHLQTFLKIENAKGSLLKMDSGELKKLVISFLNDLRAEK